MARTMVVTRVALPTGTATVDEGLDSDRGGDNEGMRQGLANIGSRVIEKEKVVVSAVKDMRANTHVVRKTDDTGVGLCPPILPPMRHPQVRPRAPRHVSWPQMDPLQGLQCHCGRVSLGPLFCEALKPHHTCILVTCPFIVAPLWRSVGCA